jgi:hypothetical protein
MWLLVVDNGGYWGWIDVRERYNRGEATMEECSWNFRLGKFNQWKRRRNALCSRLN